MEKKGISVMIGYVLLVVFVIIIGAIVYQWLKTYVPSESLDCPEGVSLFIKEARFNSTYSQLTITLRNNGRFDLAGYFIHATNSSDQELPIIDLSGYLNNTGDLPGMIHGNSVLFFEAGENLFSPGSERSYFFDIPSEIGEPYSIRITPTRYQDVDEKERFVSCSKSRASQIVGEPIVPCEPEDISVTCGTWVCGQRENNCGEWVSCPPGCTLPEVCNGTGQCVPPEECTDTCLSLGYECGTWEICGVSTDCLPGCTIPEVCNVTGQCEDSCGDGICQTWEDCSCSDCEGQQAQCEPAFICDAGGSCVFNEEGGFNSCGDYCYLFGYSQTYACQDTPQKCAPPQGPEGGIYIGDVEGANETLGNSFCLGDPYCCCIPI